MKKINKLIKEVEAYKEKETRDIELKKLIRKNRLTNERYAEGNDMSDRKTASEENKESGKSININVSEINNGYIIVSKSNNIVVKNVAIDFDGLMIIVKDLLDKGRR